MLLCNVRSVFVHNMQLRQFLLAFLAHGMFVLQRPRTLPWRKATTHKRMSEEVRPIHWSNRPKAYLTRTADWESFPAGARPVQLSASRCQGC